MKKITQILFSLSFLFGFTQTNQVEFDNMVEAEMKSAASTMSVQVNPNTQNYDITYHELRFTVGIQTIPLRILQEL